MVWQDFYRQPGGDFGILPNSQYYGPQGHRGKDYQNPRSAAIPAYEHGIVVRIWYSSYIGWVVTVQLDDGLFASWAHTRDIQVGVGWELWPGTTVAYVAGADDNPGSTWGGEHSHTTLGPSVASVFEGTVYDPEPRITAAINGVSGSGGSSTPVNNKTYRIGEEDMAEPIYAKGNTNAAVYALYVTAGANNDSADLQGNVYAARRKVEAGEWAIVNAIGFPHPKQTKLAVIPQADFDRIPKVFGSN